MTIQSTVSRTPYKGNSKTTQFAVPFQFLDDTWLTVILRAENGTETLQKLNSDYKVTGAGNPQGGNIIMTVAPQTDTTLVISRYNIAATQLLELLANGDFPADSIMKALDKLTLLAQQSMLDDSRSLKFPLTDDAKLTNTLPSSKARAGRALTFDDEGNAKVSVYEFDDLIDIVADAVADAKDYATASSISADSSATSKQLANDWAEKETAIAPGHFSAKYWADQASKATIPDNAITTDKVVDKAITTAKINDKAVTIAKLSDDVNALLSAIYPVGSYLHSEQTANFKFGNGTFLICNGASYDPIAYPETFKLIGKRYGGSDAAPLLPNLTGKVLAMCNTSSHLAGSSAGNENVDAPLPKHGHGIIDPKHPHSFQFYSYGGNAKEGALLTINSGQSLFPTADGNSIHNGSIGTNATGISIQETGTVPTPQVSVIQPTLYVQNIFIFAR